MSLHIRTGALLALFVALSGCSIQQTVDPVSLALRPSAEICMIPAEGVRLGFTETYRRVLEEKGFVVKQLNASARPTQCSLSTSYIGNWSWDLALYLSYADIKVFKEGVLVGHANYNSRQGGGRLDKFINAEEKIRELGESLFPEPLELGTGISEGTASDRSLTEGHSAALPSKQQIGRWDRPAQQLGANLGCAELQLARQAPGTELYIAGCPNGLTSIRCEWSQCTVLE